jgi:hypothetical protein
MFHVKHRARIASILRINVSRETSLPRGLKTRFCKTTPCIKKSSLYSNDMTCAGFGTSEPPERHDSDTIVHWRTGQRRAALAAR